MFPSALGRFANMATCRVLRLTLLAPDIVGGRQPEH